jgi:hypothetical protein
MTTTMTRDQIIRQMRKVSSSPCSYLPEVNSNDLYVRFDDLKTIDREQLRALLVQVRWDVGERGLWFSI